MRNLLTFVLLWCTILSAYAQDVQIKGVVISGEDNLPLPGVNVVVKGTTIGTTTDFDGQYVIDVVNKKSDGTITLKLASGEAKVVGTLVRVKAGVKKVRLTATVQ